MQTDVSFLFNVIMPIIIAGIYFVMARYIKIIAPMRFLITGKEVYQYKFWAFIFFGIFLLGRPLQILLGPHPFPLIISSIREFIMIAIVVPCLISGMMYHIFYNKKIDKRVSRYVFLLGFILGCMFIVFNFISINGSREFILGNFFGYVIKGFDGGWFLASNINKDFVRRLFFIRLVDPVILLLLASVISFWRAKFFPKDSMYGNFPKKYMLEGLALFLFSVSLLLTGFVSMFWGVQSQWYYLGALIAGIVEIQSLRTPIRDINITNNVK